jgi:hypothetical protein
MRCSFTMAEGTGDWPSSPLAPIAPPAWPSGGGVAGRQEATLLIEHGAFR